MTQQLSHITRLVTTRPATAPRGLTEDYLAISQ